MSAVKHCTDTLSRPTPCSAMRYRTAASLPPYAAIMSGVAFHTIVLSELTPTRYSLSLP